MFNQIKIIIIAVLVLVPISCSRQVKVNNIRGQIISSSGPLASASIWLSKLSDAECATLNDKILSTPDFPDVLLSETEYYQVQECMSPFASTTTDADGNYIIENVPAGLYHLSFQGQQNQTPLMNLDAIPTEAGYSSEVIGVELHGIQRLVVSILEDNPGIYYIAIVNPSINFSADTELVVNFTW